MLTILQCRALAPGAYDIAVGGFSGHSVQQRAQGPGWQRAQEVARLAGIPHMLYKEQWNHKKFLVCMYCYRGSFISFS